MLLGVESQKDQQSHSDQLEDCEASRMANCLHGEQPLGHAAHDVAQDYSVQSFQRQRNAGTRIGVDNHAHHHCRLGGVGRYDVRNAQPAYDEGEGQRDGVPQHKARVSDAPLIELELHMALHGGNVARNPLAARPTLLLRSVHGRALLAALFFLGNQSEPLTEGGSADFDTYPRIRHITYHSCGIS